MFIQEMEGGLVGEVLCGDGRRRTRLLGAADHNLCQSEARVGYSGSDSEIDASVFGSALPLYVVADT